MALPRALCGRCISLSLGRMRDRWMWSIDHAALAGSYGSPLLRSGFGFAQLFYNAVEMLDLQKYPSCLLRAALRCFWNLRRACAQHAASVMRPTLCLAKERWGGIAHPESVQSRKWTEQSLPNRSDSGASTCIGHYRSNLPLLVPALPGLGV
jgi:hypothetical protein